MIKIKDLHMFKEISEQPSALRNAFAANIGIIKKIVFEAKKRKITNIVVVARGSSDNACWYFKYLCEIYAGIPVTFAMPSVITKYNAHVNYKQTMMIGVSQSGTGIDVAAVLEEGRKSGCLTVSLTNFSDSLISKTCEFNIDMNTEKEVSVAATKTFSLEMYLLGLVAAELGDSDYLRKQLSLVPDKMQIALDNQEVIFDSAKIVKDINHCYLLGRGINYCSTLEIGLKLQETSYVKSKPFAVSVFYHGPVAVIDETQNVFLIHGKGVMDEDMHAAFNKMIENGATVYVVTNDDSFNDYAKTIKVPECDEVISPFVLVETMQLFVCQLAVSKGNNPDTPRGLNKVTITK